jgi:3-deoxy-D-manno-octulosonic-acid transferase
MGLFPSVLDLGMYAYHGLLSVVGVFHSKAKAITKGQRNAVAVMSAWRKENQSADVLWMHVASLGEFEQGRPVLEAFRLQYPQAKIALTFYSPSGFEVRKNYAGADIITYLPLDTTNNMSAWCDILRPKLMLLVKYEVWPNMLRALGSRNVPVVMFSGLFYPEQRFFGRHRSFWKSVLNTISFFHVQDDRSAQLLAGLGLGRMEVSGDTRFDRVLEIAKNAQLLEKYVTWKGTSRVVILGSSYSIEENAVATMIEKYSDVKWVVAPHHIDEVRIAEIEEIFKGRTVRATDLKNGKGQATSVLILNTMGELGGLYKLGDIAVVGGGWGKGIHNVLEPAAHGCAVIWGPNAEKFQEAQKLRSLGAGIQVENQGQLVEQLELWLDHEEVRKMMGISAAEAVSEGTGATRKVLKTIGEFWT